jgi:hypothetical protein
MRMNYPAAEKRGISKGNVTPQAAGNQILARLWRIDEIETRKISLFMCLLFEKRMLKNKDSCPLSCWVRVFTSYLAKISILTWQLNILIFNALLSFPRKRESRKYGELWIPALRFAVAGMTYLIAGLIP